MYSLFEKNVSLEIIFATSYKNRRSHRIDASTGASVFREFQGRVFWMISTSKKPKGPKRRCCSGSFVSFDVYKTENPSP
jgi:hypothetical protein